jgi:uncharacterized protein
VPGLIIKVAAATWEAVFMAAPWILFGLLVAGFLYVYLPKDLIKRAMGGNSFGAVLRAALVGAPLPLCSCGVIPTALHLRKEGAGRGPVLSFLISTPETNVDSVALTYAMMGPVMAVARPVAAIISAIIAGLGEALLGAPDPHAEVDEACGCKLCESQPAAKSGGKGGLPGALRYGAVVLMRDLAPWLVLGLILAGLIGALVPEKFFEDNKLGSGLLPMLLMALLATPMYMCTTASTPVAAALIMKGVSPGAALVFLLVGPATNIATMTMVGRFLGKRSLAIYLSAMVGTSLLMGTALDYLAGSSIAKVVKVGQHQHSSPWLTAVMWATTILFLLLTANGLRLRAAPYLTAWKLRLGFAPPAPVAAATSDACCAPVCCETDKAPEVETCGCEGESTCGQEKPAEPPDDSDAGASCPHCHDG